MVYVPSTEGENLVDRTEQARFAVTNRVAARIGSLYFKYEDPGVDVTTEQRTVEHETIDNTIVIQTMGRSATQVTINSILADWELPAADALTELGIVTVRTARWRGNVVVTSVDTSFRREKDKEGAWLYDCTIECLEAN